MIQKVFNIYIRAKVYQKHINLYHNVFKGRLIIQFFLFRIFDQEKFYFMYDNQYYQQYLLILLIFSKEHKIKSFHCINLQWCSNDSAFFFFIKIWLFLKRFFLVIHLANLVNKMDLNLHPFSEALIEYLHLKFSLFIETHLQDLHQEVKG